MSVSRLKLVLCSFAVALLAVIGPGTVDAAVIVGGSGLLDTTSANQLETWLGEGPITLTRIFQKQPGDDSLDFHAAVDGKGRTFSVLEVGGGYPHQIIGGYNPQSWDSSNDYHYSATDAERTAFIFNLTSTEIQRQSLVAESSSGVWQTYNAPAYGPTFGGGHDIYVRPELLTGYSFNQSYGGTYGVNSILMGIDGYSGYFSYGQIEVFTIAPADQAAVPEPASFLAWSTFVLLGLAARVRVAIGDRVKILRGALAGLVGKVFGIANDNHCVLALDGLNPGVNFVISRDALTLDATPSQQE